MSRPCIDAIFDRSNRVFVIAEAGVNHNGDVDIAKGLIEAAKDAGADCVKFQTFRAERVATRNAPKAGYQLETTDASESQFEMLEKLELDSAKHRELLNHCTELGIEFLSTPYDAEDISLLEELGVAAHKVASGQLVEPAFLRAVARTGKPVLLSTGMATLAEVDEAVRTLRIVGNERLALLQCTTNYPSRLRDADLLSIPAMASAFGTVMGYSDHTLSNTACLVSIGLGARVIEKHLTLDKKLPGPDHAASADPGEFRELVRAIREAEETLGLGRKAPCEAERVNARGMRRSLVASRPIRAGERFGEEMLAARRPGTGIRPALLDELLGCAATRDIGADEMITWAMCGERA